MLLYSADMNSNYLSQCFPTCSYLQHLTEDKCNLLHQVANPSQFASRFDDILKTYFSDILKNVLTFRYPWALQRNPRVPHHPGWVPLA